MATAPTPPDVTDFTANEPQCSRQEVLSCALPVWYEQFKAITIRSMFITLPQEFVEYLNSNGLVLPEGCSLPSHIRNDVEADESISDDDKIEWSDSDSNPATDSKALPPMHGRVWEQGYMAPSFPELIHQISDGIEALGGAVMPKLNWSSPRDATWIAPSNTLQCTTAAEVILLLKSSDFIAHDLSTLFEYSSDQNGSCTAYTLCLREWMPIHPSSEFRCFVYENQLIGISQRDYTAFYSHLPPHREAIRREIMDFFQLKIAGRFPSTNYVFDVYREEEGRITLVDFNPYSAVTDTLLFSWEELKLGPAKLNVRSSEDLPELRVVGGGDSSVQPSDLHSSRLPTDIVELSTGEDIHKFVDLLKCRKLGQDSSSNSET